MSKILNTNCQYCGYLCAFKARVEDGRVVDMWPDATRYPHNENVVKKCVRWRMNIEQLDSQNRINYPMRRVGERGES
ncbi:MAG: hypothetical protein MJ189_04630, partial [Coriobacteriales bacterium]|nr:hypothetical protein [Coriobacteriales bacterium]